jgi:hypothetical protein
MRILLGTQRFDGISGAPMIVLELIEYFRSRGHTCDIATLYSAQPMIGLARQADARIFRQPWKVNALEYDLCWLQHQIAPVLKYEQTPNMRERTLFAFAHLGVQALSETPGVVLEPLIADAIFANSSETKEHLAELGIPRDDITIFFNAAPQSFRTNGPNPRSVLRTITIVSNHAPQEVVEAGSILSSQGLAVRHIGKGGAVSERITPEIIDGSGVVLTIGKTVQYALASRVPVYVYDRFGGPGYLNAGTFDAACGTNFSGRCCQRKLGASDIAREIVTGFADAVAFTASLPGAELDKFRLEPYLDRLLSCVCDAVPNIERLALLARNKAMISREWALVRASSRYYAALRRLEDAKPQ